MSVVHNILLGDVSPSGGGYVAKAVHFDGLTWLLCNALSCTNNGYFAAAISFLWEAGGADYPTFIYSDPADTNGTHLDMPPPDGLGLRRLDIDLRNNPYSGGGDLDFTSLPCVTAEIYHTLIVAGQTNLSDGNKIIKVKLDGVDAPLDAVTDGFPSFILGMNGLPLYIGDDSFGDTFLGRMSLLRIMPGVNLLVDGDIPAETQMLFFDGLVPRDPAIATAALSLAGTPLFHGDAPMWVAQAAAQSFAITGTLTTAAAP